MIRPGDVVARRDTSSEIYVAVLSNELHVAAATGRTICCPFIPGRLAPGAIGMVVPVEQPFGVLLPELVASLPTSSLDGDPIGSLDRATVRNVTERIFALIETRPG